MNVQFRLRLAMFAGLVLGTSACLLGISHHAHADEYSAPAMKASIVDAITGRPLAGAVVNALWLLQDTDEQAPSDDTPQFLDLGYVRADIDGHFSMPSWKKPLPSGKQPRAGMRPLLRIYATGYHRLELRDMETGEPNSGVTDHGGNAAPAWHNQTLSLEPLAAQGGDTLVSELLKARQMELTTWREDIDNVSAAAYWEGDSQKALVAQAELVRLFAKNCLLLDADWRQRVCLDATTPVSQYLGSVRLEDAAQATLQPANGVMVAIPSEDPEEAARRAIRTIDVPHSAAPATMGSAPAR